MGSVLTIDTSPDVGPDLPKDRVAGARLLFDEQPFSFGGRNARLLDRMPGSTSEHHHARERTQTDEQKAQAIISARLKKLGWAKADLVTRRKSDPHKVALARDLRSQTR